MKDILVNTITIISQRFSGTFPAGEHQVWLMMHMNDKIHSGVEGIELKAMEHLEEELQFLDANEN